MPTQKHKKKKRSDDKRKSKGAGRQKLKHADGDFPYCMRRGSEDNETKMRENENSKGRGGGRRDTVGSEGVAADTNDETLMVTFH